MNTVERNKRKPQEVITLIRDLSLKNNEKQSIHYPELEELFDDGFYIDDFRQTIIGSDHYLITFVLRKFNPTTY